MAHVVSAFAAENRVALAQLGVLDKENEIVAIPKLLAMLDLKGATVASFFRLRIPHAQTACTRGKDDIAGQTRRPRN